MARKTLDEMSAEAGSHGTNIRWFFRLLRKQILGDENQQLRVNGFGTFKRSEESERWRTNDGKWYRYPARQIVKMRPVSREHDMVFELSDNETTVFRVSLLGVGTQNDTDFTISLGSAEFLANNSFDGVPWTYSLTRIEQTAPGSDVSLLFNRFDGSFRNEFYRLDMERVGSRLITHINASQVTFPGVQHVVGGVQSSTFTAVFNGTNAWGSRSVDLASPYYARIVMEILHSIPLT